MKTVIYFVIFAWTLTCAAHTNELSAAIRSFPDFPAGEYRPDLAVKFANILIVSGKDSACAALEMAAKKATHGMDSERICLLCRLLFVANSPTNILRAPGLGEFLLIPFDSMPNSAWPDLPFAIIDDVPLSVSDGYFLAGVGESSESYLNYCRSNGVFRSTLYPAPTPHTVSNALNKLLASSTWKSINWTCGCEADAKKTLWKQVTNMTDNSR